MKKLILLFLCLPLLVMAAPKVKISRFVIAHRGAWKKQGLPENSIASLKEAIKLGCYGAEFDVHMTADSVLVINHDHEFLGLPIETSTYQQLLTKKHTNGETIPTLEAYLKEGIKQKKTKLILEIKASEISKERSITMTQKVMQMVKDLKAEKWMEYLSFDDAISKEMMRVGNKAKVSYLNGEKSPQELKSEGYFGLDYHYSVFEKHPEWIKEAKDLGLKSNSWTVNDTKIASSLLKNKVDFITTNEPELLMELKK